MNTPARGAVGFLNPRIYPLINTANFFDVTSGTNTGYSATAGYDMVTGVGVPTVSTLLSTLLGPTITGINPTSGTTGTSVTITGTNCLTVPLNPNNTDVKYTVQVTSDLTNPTSWTSVGTTVDQSTSTLLQVHDNTAVSGTVKRFIRLYVTR